MTMGRKTNVNNLTIVWQGQSWSVLSPTGVVLKRFTDKGEAIRYAKTNMKYVGGGTKDYVNDDFIEFRDYVFSSPKSKRRNSNSASSQTTSHDDSAFQHEAIYRRPRFWLHMLLGVVAVTAVSIACIGIYQLISVNHDFMI